MQLTERSVAIKKQEDAFSDLHRQQSILEASIKKLTEVRFGTKVLFFLSCGNIHEAGNRRNQPMFSKILFCNYRKLTHLFACTTFLISFVDLRNIVQ